MNTNVLAAIDTFVSLVAQRYAAYNKATGFTDEIHAVRFDVEKGQRYARIVRANVRGSSRSVHCFVDMTSGDIYKSASWKAPAKGVRGNVLSSTNGAEALTDRGTIFYAR